MNEDQNVKFNVKKYVEKLSDKDTAINFCEENEICDIESIEEIQGYTNNQDHMGMILTVKEKDKDARFKIMMDIRSGEPSIDQVYDAVYETGRECSKRVILYTGGLNVNDKDNPAVDEWAVGSLVANMNVYPLDLYLFKIDKHDLKAKRYDLDYHKVPKTGHNYSVADIPTDISFRNSEFWLVYFDCLNEAYYRAWNAFEYGFKEISEFGYMTEIDRWVESTVWWNDSGIHFIVQQTDDSDGSLKKIWSLKQKEFQNRYGSDSVEFEYLPGDLPRLTIRYLDRPLKWLLHASPHEKAAFAKTLHDDFFEFYYFFADLYDECEESVLQKAKY